jgi:hypothetical protein
MYNTINNLSRQLEERRVSINEVNTEQRFISAKDITGATVTIKFDLLDPLITIPNQGEIWVVKRQSDGWRLDRKLETGNEITPVSALQPGDKRVEGSNVYINGTQSVSINGDINLDGTSWVDHKTLVDGLQQQISTAAKDLTPWDFYIFAAGTPAFSIGTWAYTQDATTFFSGYRASTSTVVDDSQIQWDVILGEGDWVIEYLGYVAPTYGIWEVSLDGIPVVQIDLYNVGIIPLGQLSTTFTVSDSTKKRLGFKAVGLNSSSTGYDCGLAALHFTRTA